MASLERTAYPRFKRCFTPDELREIYTPTPAEIAFGLANTTGQQNFFNLIVLLKSFQRLGYFPPLTEIPAPIISHIRGCLNLPEEISLGYDQSRSLYRHKSQIRAYLQVTPFNPEARHLISQTVSQSAQVMDNPADLINVAIEVLVKDRYELPGFNTLDRLGGSQENYATETGDSITLLDLLSSSQDERQSGDDVPQAGSEDSE